jgi:chemotaxis response regulator CheB
LAINQLTAKSHDVVVIGGSAGSIEPLRTLLGALPSSLPAAVFVFVAAARCGSNGVTVSDIAA